jgi:hypothetical protein
MSLAKKHPELVARHLAHESERNHDATTFSSLHCLMLLIKIVTETS